MFWICNIRNFWNNIVKGLTNFDPDVIDDLEDDIDVFSDDIDCAEDDNVF